MYHILTFWIPASAFSASLPLPCISSVQFPIVGGAEVIQLWGEGESEKTQRAVVRQLAWQTATMTQRVIVEGACRVCCRDASHNYIVELSGTGKMCDSNEKVFYPGDETLNCIIEVFFPNHEVQNPNTEVIYLDHGVPNRNDGVSYPGDEVLNRSVEVFYSNNEVLNCIIETFFAIVRSRTLTLRFLPQCWDFFCKIEILIPINFRKFYRRSL